MIKINQGLLLLEKWKIYFIFVTKSKYKSWTLFIRQKKKKKNGSKKLHEEPAWPRNLGYKEHHCGEFSEFLFAHIL